MPMLRALLLASRSQSRCANVLNGTGASRGGGLAVLAVLTAGAYMLSSEKVIPVTSYST